MHLGTIGRNGLAAMGKEIQGDRDKSESIVVIAQLQKLTSSIVALHGEPVQLILRVEEIVSVSVTGIVNDHLHRIIDILKDFHDLLDVGSKFDQLSLNLADGEMVGKAPQIADQRTRFDLIHTTLEQDLGRLTKSIGFCLCRVGVQILNELDREVDTVFSSCGVIVGENGPITT